MISALVYCSILQPISWDSLNYHFPAILEAFQSKQWDRFTWYEVSIWPYPKFVESLYLWWILHFGHHAYLLLGMLPIIFGGFIFFRIGILYQINSWVLVCFWCTVPLIVKQAHTIDIDSFIAFFASLTIISIIEKNKNIFTVAVTAFTISKWTSLLPGGFFIFLWSSIYKRLPVWAVTFIIILSMGTVVPNWIRYRNPIFPFELDVFDYSLFKGIRSITDIPNHAAILGNFENYSDFLKIFISYFTSTSVATWDMPLGGFGIPLVALAFIGFIYQIFLFIKTKRNVDAFEFLPLFLFSYPLWVPRYNLALVVLFAIFAARLVQLMPQKARSVVWTIFLIQSCWLWLDRSWFMGLRNEYSSAFHERRFSDINILFAHRFKELLQYGEPQIANNDAEKIRIKVRKTRNQTYFICDGGPAQLGAFYGADFSNRVIWEKGRLPLKGHCSDGVWNIVYH